MSTPPKCLTILSKAVRTDSASVTSQATGSAVAPIFSACAPAAAEIHVEQRDFGAGRGEGFGGCGADGAAGAGDGGDLAGERQRSSKLARAPSLACSSGQYSQSNMSASEIDSKWPIASASLTPSIHGFGDIGGDVRVASCVRPRPNRPRPGTSTTRGRGSSSRLMPPARLLLRAK